MTITLDQLSELHFRQTHDIALEDGMPLFRRAAAGREASLYCWVSPRADAGDCDVLYVGKAGYGVDRRLQQHQGGFVHSGTGRHNRQLITAWIAAGRSILVFTRVASTMELFGVEVSLYSSEEEAFCQAFEPLWNRAAFPGNRPLAPARGRARAAPAEAVELECAATAQLAHGDELVAHLESLPPIERARFRRLLDWAAARFPEAAQKIVRGYTDQPTGYNGVPMLVFARIGPSGRATPHGWVARIPLTNGDAAPMTIILPESARRPDLDPARAATGRKGGWRPLDLDAFLQSPDAWLR